MQSVAILPGPLSGNCTQDAGDMLATNHRNRNRITLVLG